MKYKDKIMKMKELQEQGYFDNYVYKIIENDDGNWNMSDTEPLSTKINLSVMNHTKEKISKYTSKIIESQANDSTPKCEKKYKHDASKLIKRLSKKLSEQ